MIYDDGSEIYIDPATGTSWATDTSGKLASSVNMQNQIKYYADVKESNKLNAYVAAPAGDTRPWYERVAEFGMTRAIDSHYQNATVQKGSLAASYAGQNGLTYTNGQFLGGGSMLPILLIAGVIAVVAMAD